MTAPLDTTTNKLEPSQTIREHIKAAEGFSANAYKCPAGVWTIGYGSTFYIDEMLKPGQSVKAGETISEENADLLLKKFLALLSDKMESVCKLNATNTTQNQFDAMLDFAYNLGIEALRKSTLLSYHLMDLHPLAQNEFKKWDKARVAGELKALPGLTKRRAWEAKLYGTK